MLEAIQRFFKNLLTGLFQWLINFITTIIDILKSIPEMLVRVFTWFTTHLINALLTVYNAFVQLVIDGLIWMISHALGLLPGITVSEVEQALSKIFSVLKMFDYLFPISELIICGSLYLGIYLWSVVYRLA